MRIEQMKCLNQRGLGKFEWSFPLGPALLVLDQHQQKLFAKVILELFYDLESGAVSEVGNPEGFIEATVVDDNIQYHIQRKRSSPWEIKDQTGAQIILPNSLRLGEYLFQAELRAFRQGGMIIWPENYNREFLAQLILNLRQAGDETLALERVRTSLVGAQKKINDQNDKMTAVKREYDALRKEWETTQRLLDQERESQIEIKKLKEREKMLIEKIEECLRIQARLELLKQNPDYRELRHLKEELIRSEEDYRKLSLELQSLTNQSEVDMTVVDDWREECREWALLQEQVEQRANEVANQIQKIAEIDKSLRLSGYYGMSERDVEQLVRLQAERDKALQELEAFPFVDDDFNRLRERYSIESERLQNLKVMEKVTEADERRIDAKEKHLQQWRSSKIGTGIDKLVKRGLRRDGLFEILSAQLKEYYQSYQTHNYHEFTAKLRNYREQNLVVNSLLLELKQLQKSDFLIKSLREVIRSNNEILAKALVKPGKADVPSWLDGWQEYQAMKQELSKENKALKFKQQGQVSAEQSLSVCVEQLREKLKHWGNSGTDRDEVLAALMKVARKLREKEMVEKNLDKNTKMFRELLDTRSFEELSNMLEPMAELERELRLSEAERLESLESWRQERHNTIRQIMIAEKDISTKQNISDLALLEKRIEPLKQQWTAYKNLAQALSEAQALLEGSLQEWQLTYGKALDQEMKWINKRIISSETYGEKSKGRFNPRFGEEIIFTYFSYRMAVAQLALGNNTEAPLFFFVGEWMGDDDFWKGIMDYLRKLSSARQVIVCTSEPALPERLGEKGWQQCTPIKNLGYVT